MAQKRIEIIIAAQNATMDGFASARASIEQFRQSIPKTAYDIRSEQDQRAAALQENITRRYVESEKQATETVAAGRMQLLKKQADMGSVLAQNTLARLALEQRHVAESASLLAITRNTLVSDATRAKASAQLLMLQRLQTRELAMQMGMQRGLVAGATAQAAATGGAAGRSLASPLATLGGAGRASSLATFGPAGIALASIAISAAAINKTFDEWDATQKDIRDGILDSRDGTVDWLRRLAESPPILGSIVKAGEKITTHIMGWSRLEAEFNDQLAKGIERQKQQRAEFQQSEQTIAAINAEIRSIAQNSAMIGLAGPVAEIETAEAEYERVIERVRQSRREIERDKDKPYLRESVEAKIAETNKLEEEAVNLRFLKLEDIEQRSFSAALDRASSHQEQLTRLLAEAEAQRLEASGRTAEAQRVRDEADLAAKLRNIEERRRAELQQVRTGGPETAEDVSARFEQEERTVRAITAARDERQRLALIDEAKAQREALAQIESQNRAMELRAKGDFYAAELEQIRERYRVLIAAADDYNQQEALRTQQRLAEDDAARREKERAKPGFPPREVAPQLVSALEVNAEFAGLADAFKSGREGPAEKTAANTAKSADLAKKTTEFLRELLRLAQRSNNNSLIGAALFPLT